MGNAAVLRSVLVEAQGYQDSWRRYEKAKAEANENSKDLPDPPTRDLKLEALGMVLRREIKARIHAHRADDGRPEDLPDSAGGSLQDHPWLHHPCYPVLPRPRHTLREARGELARQRPGVHVRPADGEHAADPAARLFDRQRRSPRQRLGEGQQLDLFFCQIGLFYCLVNLRLKTG